MLGEGIQLPGGIITTIECVAIRVFVTLRRVGGLAKSERGNYGNSTSASDSVTCPFRTTTRTIIALRSESRSESLTFHAAPHFLT